MLPSSFLHKSAAKAVASSTHVFRNSNDTKINSISGLRMLLIEEEPGHSTPEDAPLHPKLAFSLAMNAALAVVASSTLACRGCTKSIGDTSCKCCKVALLIPGETRKRKAKHDGTSYKSSRVGTAGKMDFPLNCHPDNISSFNVNNEQNAWDENLLDQIHIKYVTCLSDLIKYLAYAPSLPHHLQPLDGIFVLGLGGLLLRDSGASAMTELTHALSFLADTGDALESNRRKILQSNDTVEHITLVSTVSQDNYEALPKRMAYSLHQWMDFIACIKSSKDDGKDDSSMWELLVKANVAFDSNDRVNNFDGTSTLFKINHYYDAHHELCQEIVWTT